MSWEQVTGFVGAVGGILVAVLAYRRSMKVDAISAQAGVDDRSRSGTAQIIEGLNVLVDQLQEDNAAFREDFKQCVKDRDQLKLELIRMRRKYGDNGDDP